MKKSFLLAAFAIFLLSACNSNSQPETDSASNDALQSATAPAEPVTVPADTATAPAADLAPADTATESAAEHGHEHGPEGHQH